MTLKIFIDCTDGFYDSNCNSTCGQCLHGEPCDKQTGHCNQGCRHKFKPPFCRGNTIGHSCCDSKLSTDLNNTLKQKKSKEKTLEFS